MKKLLSIAHIQLYKILIRTLSMEDKIVIPKWLRNNQRNTWREYQELANQYECIRLGDGIPDFSPPKILTNFLAEVVKGDDVLVNQYTRDFGHPRLIKVLSEFYSKLIGKNINPLTEILVTVGAAEALHIGILGIVDKGDEVIVIEPYDDNYRTLIEYAGGIPRYVALKCNKTDGTISPSDFKLNMEELASTFNAKTKMIIINTPNNFIGKTFSLEELKPIADLCKKWNVLCLSDECYEWFVYPPQKHVRMASLPDMWERTLTICSFGVTFNATGWKVGWAYGPSYILFNMTVIHQFSFSIAVTMTQEALAQMFEKEISIFGQDGSYFTKMPIEMQKKRDRLAMILTKIGMKPIISDGGNFLIADWSNLESKMDISAESDEYKDSKFAKWLMKNYKLQCLPLSPFFNTCKSEMEKYVMFSFVKSEETLTKAEEVLDTWKSTF